MKGIAYVFKKVEERFSEKLQAKTGWGKNEVIDVYREVVHQVIFELWEKEEGDPK